MRIPAGRKYIVEISAPRGLGSGSIVRVYRKFPIFRRLISSDWFLDGNQAERFAREIAGNLLDGNDGIATLKARSPGWTLHRPR
jgi:hypothetical protein